MKKVVYASMLAACVSILGTGCLKDKGYENHEYGVTNPANGPKGVGFVQSPSVPLTFGLNVAGTAQTILTKFSVEADQPAQTDITITLQPNNALATAEGLTVLPSSVYTAPPMTITIPKGQRYADFTFPVNSTLTLDPNITYGLGYTITSVSGGDYQLGTNNRNLVLAFNIKNKYDGEYKLSGVHNRSPYDQDPYKNKIIHLVTAGPNTVYYYWPLAGDVGRPINNANGWYGNTVSPALVFDPASNFITNVFNYPGAAVTFTSGPATNNRFVEDTTFNGVAHSKVIFTQHYYNNNLLRMFSDTLVYVGPR